MVTATGLPANRAASKRQVRTAATAWVSKSARNERMTSTWRTFPSVPISNWSLTVPATPCLRASAEYCGLGEEITFGGTKSVDWATANGGTQMAAVMATTHSSREDNR